MHFSRNQLTGMLARDDGLLRRAIQTQVREEHRYVVEGLPQATFDRMATLGIQYARSCGFVRPAELSCFVLLMFEFGPQFWRHPAVHRVLVDPELPPERRLQRVVSDTPAAVWNNIIDALSDQSWFPESQVDDEND